MKCNLVGIQSVKSKKGDIFTVCHTAYIRRGVDGMAVETIWLPGKLYPIDSMFVGDIYNIDRDGQGYVVDFELLERKS